ncbi:tyrosine-type recombinase/integrase [Mucilaginibacter aquariorum]|uniref:Site-specific integrase n=1 Tax=Mucilaginibacter aquariorum TaxID=2967225 RepID=A0ABT1SZD8_9SPHI|nr:site-specific integrase [Mucilaginibacter aquariorum]MCQ6957714.1 site-specific integrase [Mucilaginibacter aquariorum]
MKKIGLKYTLPVLRKGKKIVSVPKGSTKIIEQAKQRWLVEYYYENPETLKPHRIRETIKLNRIKDPVEKQIFADTYVKELTDLLKSGYSPFSDNNDLKSDIIAISLKDAIDQWLEYHLSKGSRKKSIGDFRSKSSFLLSYFKADKKVKDITTIEMTNMMLFYEKGQKWVGTTFKNSRIAYVNFFNFLKRIGKVDVSPMDNFHERRKILKSTRHQIFSEQDFIKIKDWLFKNDPYALYFLQLLYYTCARPSEIRKLPIKYIDVIEKKITIPASISKNKKTQTIPLDPQLADIFIGLSIDKFPPNYIVSGSKKEMIGDKILPEKEVYLRIQKCYDDLTLTDKGYTLYSIKHYSNVRRYRNGWKLEEIQTINRHASLSETENYLRELMKDVTVTRAAPVF